MRGKNKCKILKEIRQKIADENDIPYVTRECSYQGECSGTCPKCEAELRYLERELEKRKALGKAVAVASLAASLSFASGCVPGSTGPGAQIDADPATTTPQLDPGDEIPGEYVMGEIEYDPVGIVPADCPTESEEAYELEGDVAYEPEENELPIIPIESELIDPEPTYILPTEPIVLEPESGSNAG